MIVRVWPTRAPCDNHEWYPVDTWPGPGADSEYRYQQINLVCRKCWRMAWVKPVRIVNGQWEQGELERVQRRRRTSGTALDEGNPSEDDGIHSII